MQYAAAPGTYMGNSPSTLATYSFLTWRVRICVSISRAFAGFRPNISSPEVSRSSLQQYIYQCSGASNEGGTKVREDFTITEKAPISQVCETEV